MKTALLAVSLVVLSSSGDAFESKALYRFCKGDVGPAAKEGADAVCGAYIRGVVDGLMMGGPIEEAHVFCPPKEGISADRARDIVVGYLAAHPEEGDQEAGGSAAVALVAAFRCPKKPKPN